MEIIQLCASGFYDSRHCLATAHKPGKVSGTWYESGTSTGTDHQSTEGAVAVFFFSFDA
jgi:hypothetical protein